MAQIGSCWNQASWVSSGGWAANTWATAIAPIVSAYKYVRDRRTIARKRFL